MTKSEYQELVEFLGARFQRIDARFEQIDARFEQIDARFETLEQAVRHNGVRIEQNTASIRTLAEGLTMLGERFDRFRLEVEARLP